MSQTSGMDPEHQTLLRPGASDYPAVLRRCSEDGRPLAVTARGNLGVLNGRLLGFFCSVRSPGDAILKTYDLAKTLRHADVTVIGGFQSPMEQECLAVPLRGTASVIVCPARGFNHMRTPKHWKQPVAEGRLPLLSFFDGTVRRPTAALAVKRNTHVAALAARLLIAHAEPSSKTETLCREALTQGKPVFTLNAPDDACLIALDAVPIEPADLTALFA